MTATKTSTKGGTLFTLIIAVVIAYAGIHMFGSFNDYPEPKPTGETHTVIFKASWEGNPNAVIDVEISIDGVPETPYQPTAERLFWSTIRGAREGSIVTLTFNATQTMTTKKCQILIDGKLAKTSIQENNKVACQVAYTIP